MSVHSLQVVSDGGLLSLALVCRAVAGADCRMRPPAGDDRESWKYGDPGLVDRGCWATEMLDIFSLEEVLIFDGGDGVVLGAEIDLNYDEGVLFTLAAPQTLLDGPGDWLDSNRAAFPDWTKL